MSIQTVGNINTDYSAQKSKYSPKTIRKVGAGLLAASGTLALAGLVSGKTTIPAVASVVTLLSAISCFSNAKKVEQGKISYNV